MMRMPEDAQGAIFDAIASFGTKASPRVSLARILLRERFAPVAVDRVPEPSQLMTETEQVDDYVASAFDGMSPSYLFNAAMASDVLRAGDTVVDLGCGPATQLAWTAALNPNVHFIGLDLSRECLERGRVLLEAKGVTNVELRVGDMTQLPLPNGSVDAVISTLALHHLPDVPHLERVFLEARRVLRPEGGVYLADFGRLKTAESMSDFVLLYGDRRRRRMAIDYWHSLRAAFSVDELERAAVPLAGSAEWYATWGLPVQLTMTSRPRSAPSSRMIAAIRSRYAEMSSADQNIFRTLALLARMGGMRSTHLRAARVTLP